MAYTILNNVSGEVIDSSLSAEDTAQYLLNHDGGAHDILPDGDDDAPITLFVKSRNGVWTKTWVSSNNEDVDVAEQEIFAQVVATGGWVPSLDVMTDAEYDVMLARTASIFPSDPDFENRATRCLGGENVHG